jgi:iron complex outermembrane receptor protein
MPRRCWTGNVELRNAGEQDRLAQFELPTDASVLFNAAVEFRPNPEKGFGLLVANHSLTNEEG